MTARIRLFVACSLVCTGALVTAAPDPAVSRLTAREALGRLKAGNDRFARNASAPASMSVNRRQALADAQRPFAMVLSCADARVPPEHIFNAGLGDLFVVRTAGQVIDRSVLASVEYGAAELHVPLLVVMGHESCDLVKAAADAKAPFESPNLDYALRAIQAARRADATAEDREDVKALVLAGVEQSINDVLAKSPLLRKAVAEGSVQVVGAYYELVSGRVMFSEPVPAAPTPAPASTPAAAHAVSKK